jgi:choline dehydrogenase-like flavoprotein
MHVDALKSENGSIIEGDICIIGAGASGISMALDWIGTRHKVILLEGGGFSYEDKMQELYAGKTSGQRYFPLKSIRLHYFGGTTGHWAGYCAPFEEIDFKKRDWVPNSGWPITRKDLDPYYERAQKILELGPYEYNEAYWLSKNPSLQSLPLDRKTLWNKFWQFSPPTRFGKKYRDNIVHARNIHLYTYANVTSINANENLSSIDSVTIKNFAGKSHTVKAKIFVLACCAIQNARILLASNHQAPKGLGNENDLVGRYFMEHLEMKTAELWLAKPARLSMYMMDFGLTRARAELAITEEKQREYKILNGTAELIPLHIGQIMPAFIDMYGEGKADLEQQFKEFGEKAKKLNADSAKSDEFMSFQFFTRIEQGPNPDSRVQLDHENDELGMPRAKLHWELTALEKRSLRTMHEIIGKEMGKAGIGRVRLLEYLHDEKDETWPPFTGGGWHHMGTTRMSDDPKKGVVDANCKVHGIDNLYTAGSSNFVTAAAPNPTLTIVALTLRLSDHLKEGMRN